MGSPLDPQMRQSPSGRHVGPPAGTGPFATRHRRAAAGSQYDAPLISTPTALQTNPVIPSVTAQISIPLPVTPAPSGHKWSLQALFAGNVLIVCPAEVAVRLDLQEQYQDALGAWLPLSPSGSGVWTKTITSPEAGDQINSEEAIALLALRDLSDFDLAIDAVAVSVRVAWGLLVGTGGGTAHFLCQNTPIGVLVLEDERRGWDWSVSWVLRPSDDPT